MIVIHQKSAISTTFSQQILVDRLLQVFNFNLPLRLPFYPLVIANNNLPHMICYENIADIAFLYLIHHILNLFLVSKKISLALPTPTAPNLSPARSLRRNEQRTWQLVRLLLERGECMAQVAKSLSGMMKMPPFYTWVIEWKCKPFVIEKVISPFYKYGLYSPNKMI